MANGDGDVTKPANMAISVITLLLMLVLTVYMNGISADIQDARKERQALSTNIIRIEGKLDLFAKLQANLDSEVKTHISTPARLAHPPE